MKRLIVFIEGVSVRLTRFIVLLLTMLLTSCASTAEFERMMDGYLGARADQLQRLFGYNYIQRELPGGNRAYTWVWVEKGMLPAYQAPTTIETFSSDKGQHIVVIPGTYFPATPYETSCEFTFIVDASGKTVSWRAHGTGCAYFRGPEKILGPGTGG